MAEEWIKVRVNLLDDPAVIAIAESLGLDEYAVSGRLIRIWAWADQNTADGTIPKVSAESIDRRIGTPGFAKAMCAVGWLSVTDAGIEFPKFKHHNGKSAKRRAKNRKRMTDLRDAEEEDENDSCDDGADSVHNPCTSETHNENTECALEVEVEGESTTTTTKRPAAKSEPSLLEFPCNGNPRFWHLTQSYMDRLSKAFPNLNILAECQKALVWVEANGFKTAKGMQKYLVNWMSRANDRAPPARGSPSGKPSAREVSTSHVRGRNEPFPTTVITASGSSSTGGTDSS